MSSAKFSASELRQFCIQLLTECVNVPPAEAKQIAHLLVEADLLGHQSHGTVRIPFYIRDIKEGRMNPETRITVIKDHPSTALLDAHRGWGHIAAAKAMDLAVSKAKATGIAIVGVKRSGHFALARYYADIAVKGEMVGIVFSTAEPTMAPFGGLTPLIGATPMAIGMPTDSGFPLILDMAPTVTALGNVSMAAFKGEKIPEGWVTDRQGRPTTDPSGGLESLLAIPMGQHKGYALAVTIQALCRVLTGNLFDGENPPELEDRRYPTQAHLLIAIDIKNFVDISEFKSQTTGIANRLKRSKKLTGVQEIFVPGEKSTKSRMRLAEDGVVFEKAVVDYINKSLADIGIDRKLSYG